MEGDKALQLTVLKGAFLKNKENMKDKCIKRQSCGDMRYVQLRQGYRGRANQIVGRHSIPIHHCNFNRLVNCIKIPALEKNKMNARRKRKASVYLFFFISSTQAARIHVYLYARIYEST